MQENWGKGRDDVWAKVGLPYKSQVDDLIWDTMWYSVTRLIRERIVVIRTYIRDRIRDED